MTYHIAVSVAGVQVAHVDVESPDGSAPTVAITNHAQRPSPAHAAEPGDPGYVPPGPVLEPVDDRG